MKYANTSFFVGVMFMLFLKRQNYLIIQFAIFETDLKY